MSKVCFAATKKAKQRKSETTPVIIFLHTDFYFQKKGWSTHVKTDEFHQTVKVESKEREPGLYTAPSSLALIHIRVHVYENKERSQFFRYIYMRIMHARKRRRYYHTK